VDLRLVLEPDRAGILLLVLVITGIDRRRLTDSFEFDLPFLLEL
jgi:hypothetical protein